MADTENKKISCKEFYDKIMELNGIGSIWEKVLDMLSNILNPGNQKEEPEVHNIQNDELSKRKQMIRRIISELNSNKTAGSKF